MAAVNRSNGRPEPDVIANVGPGLLLTTPCLMDMLQFGDGLSYSKTKLEETFRSGILDKPPKTIVKEPTAKKEDVDLIVMSQLSCLIHQIPIHKSRSLNLKFPAQRRKKL